MKKNVGTIDRVIRAVVGVILLVLGYVFASWWGLIGVIPLLTAALGWCPPYSILGFNTCRMKNNQ